MRAERFSPAGGQGQIIVFVCKIVAVRLMLPMSIPLQRALQMRAVAFAPRGGCAAWG